MDYFCWDGMGEEECTQFSGMEYVAQYHCLWDASNEVLLQNHHWVLDD